MHVRFIFFASSEIIMDDMSIKSRRTRSISDTLKNIIHTGTDTKN